MTLVLDWGHALPEGYSGVAWGARAIYHVTFQPKLKMTIDLLWDRQCAIGGAPAIKALTTWLNERGLDKLHAACVHNLVQPDEHKAVRIEDGDYIIDANPRESCGYLYICAYRRPCVECKKGVPEHRLYFGVMGPFCNEACRESYLSRPTSSTTSGVK